MAFPLPLGLALGGALFGFLVGLWGEYRGAARWRAAGKVVGSSLFVYAGLHFGALGSGYGRMVLVGLALSWVGDLLLVAKGARRLFRVGLFAFLAAHIAYMGAFLGAGPSWSGVVVALALVLAPAAVVVGAMLRRRVPDSLWGPVVAYIVVITAMVALAAGLLGTPRGQWAFAGALSFYLSDLAVARERFVVDALVNRVVGLPLYYGGQWLLAASVVS